ncbi:alpha-keto acid decarboxylase family protein [Staphylococcus xylosus]|mgnify:FL=1|uniref:alpha-keto acid decarboxylase family protein n=1 Tax=Staphylococcus xylosus TaxID=1288 RepID=UPI00085386A6|nr:alpha-keto acid decarboxylase family protein [Staphylococcus xylosus]MCA2499195.1 alpha-keto acid decarboxylase family protein [Staphylococcus xylosus]MCA2503464.1 alpha-keto acid decarboxylase family protein [Staphylococcus xylosus]MCE7781543.1 alpha-keto acid decarboxylase family protein [Staphylococcus xylosus]MDW8554897.1 alpha-keto acid decarboxylase family protein [Staphylococcus xylosus]OEK79783.1 pyruvate decarboxylase [Staphylococcus xylosus]
MKKRVGQYLMDCLSNVGVDKVFGVPGDFNLTFLDDIISRDDLEWVGNTNELNASYAADGYARLKGIAAMVTTFGVGELSAVNGIAGSYAERVPVIQITGAPTRAVEQAGKYVHHSLGEGRFDDYRNMYASITTTQAYITPENAQSEIPRVISAALFEKRPVHIHLPIDVANTEIEVTSSFELAEHQHRDVSKHMQMIMEKLQSADQPVIITGHEINSFGLHEELEKFVTQTHIPVAQLSLGKGAFNEESPYYMGVYDGALADKAIRDYVDQSDAILNIGAKLTDSATAGYSYQFDIDDVVMINHHNFKMNETKDTDVSLVDLLAGLNKLNYVNHMDFPKYQRPSAHDYDLNDDPLTQETYFKMMQDFIKEEDVIIAEQGTSFFGAYDLALNQHNKFIGQPLWGSIGYTLPATLGSQLADPNRRNLLLIGDGSLQLTVQAISTMIREEIKPVIFVINNDGYTVERKIHGENAMYNDIKMWDYKLLPTVFGGKEQVCTYDVNTSEEFQKVLLQVEAQPNRMHFIEVKMDVHDAPQKLNAIGQAFAKQNG